MSDGDGESDEMDAFDAENLRYELRSTTANDLFAGRMHPDDAPPEYACVARVIDAANGPAQLHELSGEHAVLETFRQERVHDLSEVVAPIPLRSSTARVSRRMAALVLAGTFATAGMAAAATGNLPDTAQGLIHAAVAPFGLTIPDGPHGGGDVVEINPGHTGDSTESADTTGGSGDGPIDGNGQGNAYANGPDANNGNATGNNGNPDSNNGNATGNNGNPDGNNGKGNGGTTTTTAATTTTTKAPKPSKK